MQDEVFEINERGEVLADDGNGSLLIVSGTEFAEAEAESPIKRFINMFRNTESKGTLSADENGPEDEECEEDDESEENSTQQQEELVPKKNGKKKCLLFISATVFLLAGVVAVAGARLGVTDSSNEEDDDTRTKSVTLDDCLAMENEYAPSGADGEQAQDSEEESTTTTQIISTANKAWDATTSAFNLDGDDGGHVRRELRGNGVTNRAVRQKGVSSKKRKLLEECEELLIDEKNISIVSSSKTGKSTKSSKSSSKSGKSSKSLLNDSRHGVASQSLSYEYTQSSSKSGKS